MSNAPGMHGPTLERFIREALGEANASAIASRGGMYLWGSVGRDAYLHSNGEVSLEEYELDQPGKTKRRYVVGRERLTNLVIAAEKRPQLRGLLPTRSSAAVTCSACEGNGHLPWSGGTLQAGTYLQTAAQPLRLWCTKCGGLGFQE